MFSWITRKLKKRQAIKRLESYRELPLLLRQMTDLQKEVTEKQYEMLSKLPPDEARKRLAAIARKSLTAMFPQIARDIEQTIPAEGRDEAYVRVMTVVAEHVAPIMEERANEMLADIDNDCRAGVDRQLDVLRGLQKEKKGGV